MKTVIALNGVEAFLEEFGFAQSVLNTQIVFIFINYVALRQYKMLETLWDGSCCGAIVL